VLFFGFARVDGLASAAPPLAGCSSPDCTSVGVVGADPVVVLAVPELLLRSVIAGWGRLSGLLGSSMRLSSHRAVNSAPTVRK
jgi:hypothetical protein